MDALIGKVKTSERVLASEGTEKTAAAVHRVTVDLVDVRFAGIKVGSYGYPTRQQGRYSISPQDDRTFHK